MMRMIRMMPIMHMIYMMVVDFLSVPFHTIPSSFEKYSSFEGILPNVETTAASSAEPKYTFAFLPIRLSKLRVEVENTKALSATLAWLPMHRLHPGISIRAPSLFNKSYSPVSFMLFSISLVGGDIHSFD